MLSVAADVGGAAAALPWHEAAGLQFPTVIDADNRLGRLLDYKVVPNGLFVDEAGRLAGRWIGFSIDDPDCVAAADEFRAGTLARLDRAPEVTPGLVAGPAGLSAAERELYDTRVRLGAALVALGKNAEAALEWKKALLMDPRNFVLRKQIWQLHHPDRFGNQIDFDWQKGQLARDRQEEAEMYAAGCGPEGCALPRQ